MKDLLQLFCGIDDSRILLTKPFSFENYTYSTDGRVCLRVPLIDGFPESNISVSVFKDIDFEIIQYEPLPELKEYQMKKCWTCNGTGLIRKCSLCGGTGEVFCDSDKCDGHECCECDGHGHASGKGEKCEDCGGKGQVEDSGSFMDIGNKRLSLKYLNKLKKCPDIQIAPNYGEPSQIMPFKFNGGHGVLMPMRKEGAF